MPKITIHRGTHQIGGTITEIATEKTHLFVDFGTELAVEEDKSTDKAMIEMIHNVKCDAILISHYHGDHVGLLAEIPESVPVYMGKTARQVLRNIREALLYVYQQPFAKQPPREEVDRLQLELDILSDDSRIHCFEDGEFFRIGDIQVTPYLVDHSAFDAYMFSFEAEGKNIVHSGDFRIHGWRGEELMTSIQEKFADKKVDALIIEGTMLTRLSEKPLSEVEMAKDAKYELKYKKYAFLHCSSANADSLASFCWAAHKHRRPFVAGGYQYRQMEEFKKAGLSKKQPIYSYTGRVKKTEISEEELLEKGFLMLVSDSDYDKQMIQKFMDKGLDPYLIYSMWDGYLDEKRPLCYNSKKAELVSMFPKDRVIKKLHTSGHANSDELKDFICNIIRPQEAIIPIHTEKQEEFQNIDLGSYGKLIIESQDGVEYTI